MVRMEPRMAIVAFLVGLLMATGSVVAQPPVTQAACAGAPEAQVFADGLDRLENLVFDGEGHLYVASIDGILRRFAADGSVSVVATSDVPQGGLAFGPDGALYMALNPGFATPLPAVGAPLLVEAGAGAVWRFGSLEPPAYDVFADGLDAPNGLAVDADGFVYVSDTGAGVILRVSPGGEVETWTEVSSPNGMLVTPDGAGLYVALTFSEDSRIERLSLADPAQSERVAALSGMDALLPKGLDDLDVDATGRIYVTGHLSGEVLQVDTADGSACVLAAGLTEPTAAAVAHGFGAHDGHLFVTTFDGRILSFAIPGADPASTPDPLGEGAQEPPAQEASLLSVVPPVALALPIALRARRARSGQ